MKEEKDIQPIDNLFRQSLEGYAPAPPTKVWKSIRKKMNASDSGLANWFCSHAGILIGSASILAVIAVLVLTNNLFNSKELANSKQDTIIPNNQSVNTPFVVDTALEEKSKTNPTGNILNTKNDKKKPALDVAEYKPKTLTHLPIKTKILSQTSITETKPTQNNPLLTQSVQQKSIKNIIEPAELSIVQQITPEENLENTKIQYKQPEFSVETAAKDTDVNILVQSEKPTQPTDTIWQSSSETNTGSRAAFAKTKKIKPGTLQWQTNIYGNTGVVLQQHRAASFMYGAMGTIGLWHNNFNAGIETGVGLQAYKDRGEIKNTYRIYDTIIVLDTIWHQDSGFIYPEIITKYLPYIYDTNQINSLNHTYLYLQFPLLITKQILKLKNLSVDLKAGPIIGLQLSKNTFRKIIGRPEGGILINTITTDYTRLQTHWQILISPQIKYNLSKKVVISFSPCLTLFPDRLYSSANRPNSTPYGLSVYGGILYKLK